MDIVSWIFFGPAKLLAVFPVAGAVIASVLIGTQACLSWRANTLLARNFFRNAAVLAGLLWLIFNLYELQVSAILARNESGSTLRMDLIILIPILYVLTVAAVMSIAAQLRDIYTGRK